MKVYCTDCGRQIVSYDVDNEYIIGGYPSTYNVKGFICYRCAKLLDENGLYPEEASELLEEKRW